MTVPTTGPSYPLYVGIDIAAATFTASWMRLDGRPSTATTYSQSPLGFATLQEHLQATDVAPRATLIVLEATSTYWIALAVTLHAAGYAVSVVNPAKVHNYAKSLPRRSKTDQLDALLLTQFAAERRPDPWTPPPAIYHELRQRLMARDGLLEMRKQARNQLHALVQWPIVVPAVQQQMEGVIASLDEQIRVLDEALAQVLATGAWAASAVRLQSIPGIGALTAAWILVTTVQFALCPTAEAAVGYAGLNPLEGSSGTSLQKRPTIGHGGNRRLRTALYLAAMSATQHNPVIKAFYERLRAAGKAPKVARCAAARKLLCLAWAVVTKEQMFDPSLVVARHEAAMPLAA
jgi:transposase